MIIKLFHLIYGFLCIKISGEFNERMLNLFSVNKINVWNITKNEEEIFVCISIKDFKKIRKIRRKTGIKISISERHGLPFVLSRYHLRYGVFAGVSLCVGLLIFLNLFVWQIKVEGNYNVDSEKILTVAGQFGLKKGAYKKKINAHELRDKILLNCDGLAWASINIEGCSVTINVSEIKNETTENSYCNLVSDYNGVIKNIVVQKGTAAVEKGDAVQKGDLLISGIVEFTGHTRFTDAVGIVTAQVEEKIEITVNQKDLGKNYISDGYKKFALEFFSVKIPLFLGGELRNYDYNHNENPLKLFGKELPITLHELEVYPYNFYDYVKSESEIKKETELLFIQEIKNRGIVDYTVLDTVEKIQDNVYLSVFTVKHTKNIGVKEKLLF